MARVVATQNPVDLDYKGLSNTGTWFIGRLQTVQDRERVLDGLEGAVQGGSFSRTTLSDTLSSLDNRVFLLHNVHESAPVIFQTRFAMSYLRGPLSRDQVRTLMIGRTPDKAMSTVRQQDAVPTAASVPLSTDTTPLLPAIPPDIPQRYLPIRVPRETAETNLLRSRPGKVEAAAVLYEPALLASGRIHYTGTKMEKDAERDFALRTVLIGGGVTWESAIRIPGWYPASRQQSPDARYTVPAEMVPALKKLSTQKQALTTFLVHSGN